MGLFATFELITCFFFLNIFRLHHNSKLILTTVEVCLEVGSRAVNVLDADLSASGFCGLPILTAPLLHPKVPVNQSVDESSVHSQGLHANSVPEEAAFILTDVRGGRQNSTGGGRDLDFDKTGASQSGKTSIQKNLSGIYRTTLN